MTLCTHFTRGLDYTRLLKSDEQEKFGISEFTSKPSQRQRDEE